MFTRNVKFELTDEEYYTILKWWEEIVETKYKGNHHPFAIGGDVDITFCQTSIGQVITAQCCGEKLVVRDI